MEAVAYLIILAVLALINKAINRDKERIINEFVESQKARENKD